MELQRLDYFVAIAQEKSLSKAAERLYVGQPTLTKYVQRLEGSLGLTLFAKKGKQMVLTYAGERYLYYAQQFLSLQRQMENEMKDIHDLKGGSLHVGINPVGCSIILPAVLPAFRKKYPKVELLIREASSGELDQALLENQIDLAFYHLSNPQASFRYDVIENDQMYVITQTAHPLRERAVLDKNGNPGLRLEWLRDEVLLLQTPQQRQGEYMLRALADKKLVCSSVQQHSNIRAALSLACSGYGVTFLSSSFLPYFRLTMEFDAYTLLDVDTPLQFVCAYQAGSYLPTYALDLIEMVRNAQSELK